MQLKRPSVVQGPGSLCTPPGPRRAGSHRPGGAGWGDPLIHRVWLKVPRPTCRGLSTPPWPTSAPVWGCLDWDQRGPRVSSWEGSPLTRTGSWGLCGPSLPTGPTLYASLPAAQLLLDLHPTRDPLHPHDLSPAHDRLLPGTPGRYTSPRPLRCGARPGTAPARAMCLAVTQPLPRQPGQGPSPAWGGEGVEARGPSWVLRASTPPPQP